MIVLKETQHSLTAIMSLGKQFHSIPSFLAKNRLLHCSEEPTKMDNDVMKALHGIEIDGNAFPHVHKWYTALLNHSLEERNK